MATLKKQALRIINDYKRKYGVDVVDLDEVALWAIREKKWAPQQAEIRRQCRELLSRALREERITDPQGRRIRKYHAIRQEKNGHTLWLWVILIQPIIIT